MDERVHVEGRTQVVLVSKRRLHAWIRSKPPGADDHRRPPKQRNLSTKGSATKKKCCKNGGIAGNFGGSDVDLRPLGTLRMKICFAMLD